MSSARPALSVLDLGVIAPGNKGADVLGGSLDLAETADKLGFHAFWVAEHHEAHFAWMGPAVMMAALAQRTRRIRLGSAAILLPLYSPLFIAETFRTLNALTPGRIDLGIAGGLPLDPNALAALAGEDTSATPDAFPRKLAELARYLRGDFPAGHRFAGGATPQHAAPPPLWVMGSSPRTAKLATDHKAHYAYSLFHRSSKEDPAVATQFRDGSDASSRLAIAITCVCAETDTAVTAQHGLVEQWLKGDMRVVISGRPEACRDQILALAERYGADEVILFHLWHRPEPRLAALHALAETFALVPASV